MIEVKRLTSEELGKIEDEWDDSTVVKKLLGHVMYLTDALLAQANQAQAVRGLGEKVDGSS